jgi:hypothetical protein
MIFEIIFFIIALCILSIGIKLYIDANKIKVSKSTEQSIIEEDYKKLQKEYDRISQQKTKLEEDIIKEKQEFEDLYEKEKNKFSEQIKIYKQNTSYASEQYVSILEQNYIKVEQEHDNKIKALENEKNKCEKELEKLRESLSAGVQANLREREKEENLQFYKLFISDRDLEDVTRLEQVKLSLHQPVILSKLIWSTYFQKQTTEMCNRILGTKKICGIYKITDLKTQQYYIGQSVDVAQRWKDHVKCGLGIEASATNKLYNAMQKDGVYNFTFELMEECPREQLNEKERFWIEMYQSDTLGFNSTKGNK